MLYSCDDTGNGNITVGESVLMDIKTKIILHLETMFATITKILTMHATITTMLTMLTTKPESENKKDPATL